MENGFTWWKLTPELHASAPPELPSKQLTQPFGADQRSPGTGSSRYGGRFGDHDIESAPGDPHKRFVEAAIGRGWRDTLSVSGQTEQLPTSTLVGKFSNLDQAHHSFDLAIEEASAALAPAKINVERRYIVERVPAGRLKATKSQWVRTNIAPLALTPPLVLQRPAHLWCKCRVASGSAPGAAGSKV
jgi:hypothetical protein